jgi:O-methyltransferase
MKNALRALLRRLVRRFVVPYIPRIPEKRYEASLISKAARFVACEMVEGDYLEFGVFRGASFVRAYRALQRQFKKRISQDEGGRDEPECQRARQEIWEAMRFFAFDSFQGLPIPDRDDVGTNDFQQGQYACSAQQFKEMLTTSGVPLPRTRIVEGWFEDTCTQKTREELGMRKAAIVWIDSDLYSSARTALSFITPLVQDGTVIIFDDWFSYRGNPRAGEQKAFAEWTQTIADKYSVQEYHKERWKRCSFIVSAIDIEPPRSGEHRSRCRDASRQPTLGAEAAPDAGAGEDHQSNT